MQASFINQSQLTTFGNFLALAYQDKPDLEKQKRLLEIITADWDTSITAAFDNRILTNVIAIIVETPELFESLGPSLQTEIKSRYLQNWRRSELIKRQVQALSTALEESNTQPVLMLKGGLRLFDNLYPGISHRYMSDIDLYYEDPAILQVLASIGYKSDEPSEFDLAEIDQHYLDRHKKLSHHLPPVYSPDHPCYLEMHQHMVQLRALGFFRPNTMEVSVPIAEAPCVLRPSLVDQLILNIVHTIYGEMFTHHANYRLRNLLEGYLLFQRLNASEQVEVSNHFRLINRQNDLDFWKLLCLKFFDAKEFSSPVNLTLKTRLFYHMKFGQSQKANATIYGFYFVWRLISKELWSPIGRSRLLNKLRDSANRHALLSRIAGRTTDKR